MNGAFSRYGIFKTWKVTTFFLTATTQEYCMQVLGRLQLRFEQVGVGLKSSMAYPAAVRTWDVDRPS